MCVAGRCQPADGGLPDSPVDDHPIDAPDVGPDVGVDLPDATGDGSDGDGAADRFDGPLTCDHSQPFTTISLVGGISPGSGMFDSAARFSRDELTVYFTSLRGGNYAIYSATRTSTADDFELASKVPNIGSDGGTGDLDPSVTEDGLTMYFDTARTHAWAIFTATRETPDAPWSAATEFAPLAHGDGISEGMPYVLPKGDAFYFQSNRAGPLLHIFRMARRTNGAWGSPETIAGFSVNNEFSPVVSDDELTLYFASDREATPEPGDYDIWMATRPSKSAAFESPTLVVGVNTVMGETPSWLSPDACRLYFTRRNGNALAAQVYVATRTPR
jgi:Tol biopolymer transport system component